MAISSTYKTFLMYKASSSSSFTKLCDIKDYGDLGGTPEMIQATTLSDKMHTYALGIQDSQGLDFTANYDATTFQTIDAMRDTEMDFAVWFGGTEASGVVTPTGSEGKFDFKGKLSVYVAGGGVNEVREMTISIAPSTPITFSLPS